MKFGVIIFPGSNCDHDAYWTVQQVAKQTVSFLWHESHDLENCDVIIVPGGFAYGDYLRTGAIAKLSPVMQSVRQFAAGGGWYWESVTDSRFCASLGCCQEL